MISYIKKRLSIKLGNQSISKSFALQVLFMQRHVVNLVVLPRSKVKIRIKILEPIYFDRSGETAAEDPEYVLSCNHRVWSQMQTTLTQMSIEADDGAGPQF